MAKVTVTFEDGDEATAIAVVMDSDPPMPMAANGDPDVDSDQFTNAMGAALHAVMSLADDARSFDMHTASEFRAAG